MEQDSTPDEIIQELQKQVVELRRQITHKDDVLMQKNIALDALHYVWCSGGCETGMHRNTDAVITEELVVEAERNTARMRRHLNNRYCRENPHVMMYDKEYGDERLCECGHPYYRHFDAYDNNMMMVGCKYCACGLFQEDMGD